MNVLRHPACFYHVERNMVEHFANSFGKLKCFSDARGCGSKDHLGVRAARLLHYVPQVLQARSQEENLPDGINAQSNHIINTFDRRTKVAVPRMCSQEREYGCYELPGRANAITTDDLVDQPTALAQRSNNTISRSIVKPVQDLRNLCRREWTAGVCDERF